jgi:hypothetical protein
MMGIAAALAIFSVNQPICYALPFDLIMARTALHSAVVLLTLIWKNCFVPAEILDRLQTLVKGLSRY